MPKRLRHEPGASAHRRPTAVDPSNVQKNSMTDLSSTTLATTRWPDSAIEGLPMPLQQPAQQAEAHIHDGRFQRSLSLLAGASSVLAGAEVCYEHYRAGFGQRVMYTPVILSGVLFAGGVAGFFSRRAALP